MLGVWKCHQSGTSTRSEHAIQLDPKFTTAGWHQSWWKEKEHCSRMKELAHHTQIAQDLHSDALKLQMACEIHWQTSCKGDSQLVQRKVSWRCFGCVWLLTKNFRVGQHFSWFYIPLILFSFILHINLILPAIFSAVELLLLCCGFCFPGYICVASISFPIWLVFDGDFP